MSHPYSQLPEWILDSRVSDRAIRIYCILSRYGNGKDSERYPSRSLLAERCRCSIGSVDRAIQELVTIKALEVTPHYRDNKQQTSRYALTTTPPSPDGGSSPVMRVIPSDEGGASPGMHNRKKITEDSSNESPSVVPSDSSESFRSKGQETSNEANSSSLEAKPYPGDSSEEDRRRLYQQFLRATARRPAGQLAQQEWWAATEDLRSFPGATPETVFFAALRQWFAWRDTEFSCTLPALVRNWERFYRPNHNDFYRTPKGRWQLHIADYHPTRPMVVAG